MKWNNDWRDELESTNYGCYERLCECRNTKKDILRMAKLVKKYNPDMPAEECLIYMLEWVGDWNGQYNVTDLTKEEYSDMINAIIEYRDRGYN